MSHTEQILDALQTGLEYARQALSAHDAQYGRHPALESERKSITDEIAEIERAMDALTAPAAEVPEPQATPIPCAVHVCGKTFEKGVPFCDVIDHVYTNTRRQTPITEDQAWSSDEIMSANALSGLLMSEFMKLIRAVEAHHGITAPAGGEKQA